MTETAYTDVSGLDDLSWSLTLKDSAGTAITSGTVRVKLCAAESTTLLDASGVAALTHTTGGVWTGGLDAATVATCLSGLAIGQLFDIVLEVVGDYQRRHVRCRKVAIVDAEA